MVELVTFTLFCEFCCRAFCKGRVVFVGNLEIKD